jgi:four helix bundle protein
VSESIIQRKSFAFALEVIRLYQQLQQRREFVLSKQLLRSGTSIGANVEEAVAAQSRRDFLSKMSVASKEAYESRYWLRLLDASHLADVEIAPHLDQINEVIRILTSIVKTTGESLATPPTQNSKLKT